MNNIEKEIEKKFGERLRLRVNGILFQGEKILLIKHQMAAGRYFWNVPGGGMDYGSDAIENLKREYMEETGLNIEVKKFLFVHEFLEPPLHAVELFFEVIKLNGNLRDGYDPELAHDRQIITDKGFFTVEEINKIKKEEKHRLFWELNSINDIRIWKGYFYFENKCIK
jgi:ADP-ribose pyrophosphatase YjhB (NUDIX family)